MSLSDLEYLKRLIDTLTPLALYSERIDSLLTWLYPLYAAASARAAGAADPPKGTGVRGDAQEVA